MIFARVPQHSGLRGMTMWGARKIVFIRCPVEERRLEAVLGVQSTDYRIHGPCYLSTIEFQIVDFAL